jgi:tRNA(Ile)-lysidine synthase
MRLLLQVKSFLSEIMAGEHAATVIVAVSGGPDSVALLHVLHRLAPQFALQLVVAHVNHALRAGEADEDEQFVRQLAAQLGLEFVTEQMDWQQAMRSTESNRQALARDFRYAFFTRVAKHYAARWVATAHHADDQAETVLMRCLRGTSVSGLPGIAANRSISEEHPNIRLVRPLLTVTKDDLLAFLAGEQLPYRTDRSNWSSDYTRNALRHSVIPTLAELFPQYRRALTRLAETAAAEEEWFHAETVRAFGQLVADDGRCRRFSRHRFMTNAVALQRRMIKLLLNYPILDGALIERVRKAIVSARKPNASFVLPHDLRFVRTYDKIELFRTSNHLQENDGMIKGELFPGELLLEWLDSQSYPTQLERFEAWFDADEVRLPLTVRGRRPGDRLERWDGGSQTVKKLMIDAKVATTARNSVPLVVDAAGMLLWVVGLSRSRHAPVTTQTKRLLRLHWTVCFSLNG